tara:strand:+ start:100 stop:486 length:387 start_codon:yes stop_codon:yes gene_type:complete
MLEKKKKERKGMKVQYHMLEDNNDRATQPWTRDKKEHLGNIAKVNSEFIFNNKNFKPNTKGYDHLTGEIEKRGKPADNQKKIFLTKPEKDLTQQELIAERKKKDAKKREAQNKKLYRARLKTKWDRGW